MDTQKKKLTQKKSLPSPKVKDPHRWGRTVRISNEIHDYVCQAGLFGETFSDVLKRLLKL
jgi:hypothetical protein